jgi:glycosyltransferase involved in cell wall biosynthesis
LVALYRRIRPDIVHHVALKAILNGSIAARLARVPAVVGSLTGLGYTFMPGGPGRAVLREIVCLGLGFALRGSRVHTIFQNPDDRELFVRRRLVNAARTSIVLGSGVDTRRFSPTPEPAGPPVVAFGSRMLWDKGIAELVEALRTLRREGVSFRARFAGTPDTSNPATVSERELKAWQAEGLIEWRGYVDDMAAFLAAAHVACLPSYREGLPLFLAEAAASGRPCVTTDVPGCRSVVIDGSTGYVVPARQAAALTHALRRLLTEPALRAKQGKAARELALESLSAERVVSDTFNVYRRLLEEARN